MRFNESARDFIERQRSYAAVDYLALGDAAQMSVPTPEHYLPRSTLLGARREDDALSILTDGIELGSISMLSFAYSS